VGLIAVVSGALTIGWALNRDVTAPPDAMPDVQAGTMVPAVDEAEPTASAGAEQTAPAEITPVKSADSPIEAPNANVTDQAGVPEQPSTRTVSVKRTAKPVAKSKPKAEPSSAPVATAEPAAAPTGAGKSKALLDRK
jgi:hypothetical protein